MKFFIISIGDHFYVVDINQVNAALSQGYIYDGAGGAEIVEGYCVSSMACGATKPLYRFYNSVFQGNWYYISKWIDIKWLMQFYRDH